MSDDEKRKLYEEYEKKVKDAEKKYDNSPAKAQWAKAKGFSREVSAEMTAVNIGVTGVKVSAKGFSTGIYGVSENFNVAAGKSWGFYAAPSIADSKVVASEMELVCTRQQAESITRAQNVISIMNDVSQSSNGAIKLKS